MPYTHVPADRFLQHGSVTVFHVYKSGCTMSNWYTLRDWDDDGDSNQGNQFDVRDLPTMEEAGYEHEKAIRLAIDRGLDLLFDPWGEDKTYPRKDWRYEVANGDTNLGYWEWVKHTKASDDTFLGCVNDGDYQAAAEMLRSKK